MTLSKKTVLFIRLPGDVETKFETLRTRVSLKRGKPINKNDLIINLIEERFDEITSGPSPQSSGTATAVAAEPQTLASALDTPPPVTCTSAARLA
jgi:hypothetical protein